MPISSKYYTIGASLPTIAVELLQNTLLTDSGCMEWQGAKWNRSGKMWGITKGYGRIKISGKDYLLHRFIFAQLVDAIGTKDLVCHVCDNPPCINPAHLFKGSITDNNRDKALKYRMTRNGKAQMSFIEKETLLRLAELGVPYAEIAELLGNSQQWVAHVARDNGIYRR